MIEVGFTTVTFRGKDLDDIESIVESNGIKCIEWAGDVHVPAGDVRAADRARSIAERHGVKEVSYGSYFTVGTDGASYFRAVCETAHRAGADIVRVWLGDRAGGETSAEEVDELMSAAYEISTIARKYGVKIAFEFHSNTYNDDGLRSYEFLTRLGADNVYTYWQPLGKPDRDYINLTEVLPFVAGAHIFSWSERGKRLPFNRHVELWRERFALLNTAGARYIMEFVRRDSVRRFEKDLSDIRVLLSETETHI